MCEENDEMVVEEILVTVRSCARCGDDHEHLHFKKMYHPIVTPDDEIIWNFWAHCPTNGDPVLLRIIEN